MPPQSMQRERVTESPTLSPWHLLTAGSALPLLAALVMFPTIGHALASPPTPPSPSTPRATLHLSDLAPQVNQGFTLEVEVRWPDGAEEVRLYPPRLHLPEGVEQEGLSAASDSAQEGRASIYRIRLVARKAGVFALGPVQVHYAEGTSTPARQLELAGPTLTVSGARLAGFGAPPLADWEVSPLSLGALGILSLALAGAGWARRRQLANNLRRQTGNAPAQEALTPVLERGRAHLGRARQWHLAGGAREAFLELAAAARLLGEVHLLREQGLLGERSLPGEEGAPDAGPALPSLPAISPEAVEQARYGGWAPPESELLDLTRRLEACLAALTPPPPSPPSGPVPRFHPLLPRTGLQES